MRMHPSVLAFSVCSPAASPVSLHTHSVFQLLQAAYLPFLNVSVSWLSLLSPSIARPYLSPALVPMCSDPTQTRPHLSGVHALYDIVLVCISHFSYFL